MKRKLFGKLILLFLVLTGTFSSYAVTGPGGYGNAAGIGLKKEWQYAEFSKISSGEAVYFKAAGNRKGKVVAVNAGHGTAGGTKQLTYSHPDKTGKVTGGTNAAGAVFSMCVSTGMTFKDGTRERDVTLRMARILKEKLLADGYDVLMLRTEKNVDLDNVARTVIANNVADIHIALHWDGDGLSYDKGCFYMSVPDALKEMEPVKSHWEEHERLGECLIEGLKKEVPECRIFGSGSLDMDLTQTSYSTIPSVDIELGNEWSGHDEKTLSLQAEGLLTGIRMYFESKGEEK